MSCPPCPLGIARSTTRDPSGSKVSEISDDCCKSLSTDSHSELPLAVFTLAICDLIDAINMAQASTDVQAVDFETALNNIRRLSNSGLAHQKKPAQLLIALEETLKASLSSEPPFSGTAYFASLVQCLEKACNPKSKDAKDFSDGGLIPATLYLMATVVPETPKQVVINQLNTLLPVLIPLFDPALSHPPALRSLVQVLTTIFLLAPVSLLNSSPLLKRAWNHFLELNVDPRPKVRHLSQEGIRKVLTTPIPPKVVAGDHPYLARARDWAMGLLTEETQGGSKSKKQKYAGGMVMAGAEDDSKRSIWVVQGLRGWVSALGEEVGFMPILSAIISLLFTHPSSVSRTFPTFAHFFFLSLPLPTSHLKFSPSSPTCCPLLPNTLLRFPKTNSSLCGNCKTFPSSSILSWPHLHQLLLQQIRWNTSKPSRLDC